MTETEAKERWCPFSRVIPAARDPNNMLAVALLNGVAAFNRVQVDNTERLAGMCVGAKCACWVFADAPSMFDKTEDRSGHCGLAR